jgi:tetratricopeptide (TPR) repeat protein
MLHMGSFTRIVSVGIVPAIVFAIASATSPATAASYSETESLFRSGKIEQAEKVAAAEVERGVWNRRWSELLIRCQLATGKYEAAEETYEAAVRRYPTSLPLRVLGIEVANFNADPDQAAKERAVIERYLNAGQLRYATTDTLVAAGRHFYKNGIDARIILKSFFDRVLESDPENLEALVATAELAISKGDFKVAADTVRTAKRRNLEDARLDYWLARALAPTDRAAAQEALAKSLQANPSFAPALIFKAENEIDSEAYQAAAQTIDRVLEINPEHPLAFALKAVLAHLKGDFEQEEELRQRALKH